MSYIPHLGNPDSRLWIVLERPFGSDAPRGELCSGGMGFAFKKMLSEAGLNLAEVFFCSRRPDTENPNSFSAIDSLMAVYKPPLVVLVGESGSYFLPDLRAREGQDTYKTQLNKYTGSLLTSPNCSNWPHYCMPIANPEDLMRDWKERNVTTYIDLGKIKEELDYQKSYGTLRPLLSRELHFHEMATDEVLSYLDRFRKEPLLSEDIETAYPKAGSEYYGEHPGVPVTFGIAPSPTLGISFSIFRETPAATREVWKAMSTLHSEGAVIIGQNFFNFDSWFYSMLGFSFPLERIQDTLIRHHILWPELPHKLQFLTRQYTRQPYYKDQSEGWSNRKGGMDRLRHYNCLDATVTYEVWEGQEKEFALRPHLR